MRAVRDSLAGQLALFPRGFDVVVAADQDVVPAVSEVHRHARVGQGGKSWKFIEI